MNLKIIPVLQDAIVRGVDEDTGELVCERGDREFIRVKLSFVGMSFSYSVYDVATDVATFYEGPYGDPRRDVVVDIQ